MLAVWTASFLRVVFVRCSLSSSTSRVTITRIIVTLVALRMVEMAIWFFLSTVVVVVTALLDFLVLKKFSKNV